ncbi:hypothetical protein [Streptomyces sp. SID8374]|uniref:hypothetical protein n=1 Tax=Streptomyces sp. SID8374 TaxID=2690354 RepID=UPI001F43AA69|nr:hypothetical protein [Streptomyces sp. SID8374]
MTPDQVVELYGPDNDGWYDTRVKDWIALCEDLKDGEVRGYLVLRGLVVDKFKNHVRVLTLRKLCELIPGPGKGKGPSSLTRVRGILDGLTKVGLVTTPEGQPIKTSSRESALMKPLRLRINDDAPVDYAGWRNAEDKLRALGTALAELVEKDADGADKDVSKAGRKSDPDGEAGRISDPSGRISDPQGRISDPLTGDDQQERDLPLVSSSGSSLSPSAADAAATSVTPDTETETTRETAAPEDNPAPAAAAGVPAPRDGQGEELLEMLLGLPGRDRMNRAEVEDMLLPLASDALAEGWTIPKLRSHLARSCDPDRVFNVVAVYRNHLKKLPPVPTSAVGHPAAAAPKCSKCNGSGLAEDPETFLPIGPCECRQAPVLAAAS